MAKKESKTATLRAKKAEEKLTDLEERFGEEMLRMVGYDDCIVGVVTRFGLEPIICYDKDKVIKKLMSDGMTHEEAVEFFEFNQIGAWMGDRTPCFLER